ncbi:MAG: hypothetical protein IPJ82_25225 [Lewinellaceae bacterium]|nr:hypothetical protein [Lewinellaceae bacterium]
MICEICGRPNHCRSNIELLYGGFHLVPFDRQKIEAIAYYLKNDLGVHRVAPAHCTGTWRLRC